MKKGNPIKNISIYKKKIHAFSFLLRSRNTKVTPNLTLLLGVFWGEGREQ